MATAIEFEQKDERCTVGFLGDRKAVRAIQESDGWRIDHCSAVAGAWLPWEPINDIRYTSRQEAISAIQEWAS